MKVLVAGATSTLGRPVVRELRARGHEVAGLTRSRDRAAVVEEAGAASVVADVLNREGVREAVRRADPEAIVSLLIKLPRRGPVRMGDFKATRRLWTAGVPNLLEAGGAAGVRRFVAESVVFAYGYGRLGPGPLHESEPRPGDGVIRGQREVLEDLRGMEDAVLGAARTHGIEGLVLRYGMFHGAGVPTSEFMLRLLRARAPLLPGGGKAVGSWIEVRDAARATADALERGRPGEIYNVVDDRPIAFAEYARELARAGGAPRPRSAPLALARLATPYAAVIMGETELPVSNEKAKRELGWEPRFGNPLDVLPEIAAGQAA